MNNRFKESNPFPPLYEYTIAEESKAIGRNLGGELRFWQETGATIVAIRRDGGVINLSPPGPLERLVAGDILMMVGPHDCLRRTEQLFDGN